MNSILSMPAKIVAFAMLVAGFTSINQAQAQTTRLFAFNNNTNKIETYNTANGTLLNSSFISNLQSVYAMTADIATNSLYIADGTTNSVRAFDASTGALQSGFSAVTGPLGAFYFMLVQNGVLYIADTGGRVRTVNATTGASISNPLVSTSSGSIGLATTGSTLFVSNYNGSVGTYNASSGSTLNASFITSGLSSPYAMAVNGNILYIADPGNGKIVTANATTGAILNSSFVSLYAVSNVFYLNGVIYASSSAPGPGTTKIGAYDATTGAAINGFTQVTTNAGYSGIAVIPEPSTCALMGFGLGATCLMLRRRISGV